MAADLPFLIRECLVTDHTEAGGKWCDENAVNIIHGNNCMFSSQR